jgi:hypothetical protein
MTDRDEILEEAAQQIGAGSLLDYRGVMGRRKRDREDAKLRSKTIEECRVSFAAEIRRMKGNVRGDPKTILEDIRDAPEGQHTLLLTDAWPLAWLGLLDIYSTTKVTGNSVPPQTLYRIEITEKGHALLNGESDGYPEA